MIDATKLAEVKENLQKKGWLKKEPQKKPPYNGMDQEKLLNDQFDANGNRKPCPRCGYRFQYQKNDRGIIENCNFCGHYLLPREAKNQPPSKIYFVPHFQ